MNIHGSTSNGVEFFCTLNNPKWPPLQDKVLKKDPYGDL
jgi:hypothetical protein